MKKLKEAIKKVTEKQLKQAAYLLNTKPLKSDNIALGGVIPLTDGKKGVIVEEVKNIGKTERI